MWFQKLQKQVNSYILGIKKELSCANSAQLRYPIYNGSLLSWTQLTFLLDWEGAYRLISVENNANSVKLSFTK